MTRGESPQPDHPSAQWQTLVTAAVLGTDRAGAALPPDDAAWSISQPDGGAAPATQLLHQASTLGLYELAGREPARRADRDEAIVECKVEENRCPPEAARHLAEVLDKRSDALLMEWSVAATAAGWVAPSEALPSILRRARSTKADMDPATLLTLAGERGRWLAEQHSDWRRLYTSRITSPQQAQKQWESGTRAQRLTLLRLVRQSDPAQARVYAQATWSEESADDRKTILETFDDTLESADEPWLEERLDDRSKQVRAAAARLLSRLPGSALSRRMEERIARCVRFTPGAGILKKKKPALEVTLPESTDAAMKRDGMEVRSRLGMGNKAALFNQIAAHAPLDGWIKIGGSPDRWVQAALNSEWAFPCIDAWATAAATQHHADWAQVLISNVCLQTPGKKDAINTVWRLAAISPLMACLSNETAEQLALSLLNDTKRHVTPAQMHAVLVACKFPWPAAMSSAVIRWIPQQLKHKEVVYDAGLRSLITGALAQRLSPQCADEITKHWPTQADHWSTNFEEAVGGVIDTLRFRRDMLAALKPDAKI